MTAGPQTRHPVPDHIPEQLREAFATTKGRDIPQHSPYQSGDAVQMRGCPGEMPGHRQTGFRGWVVATVGATILTGITTDGEEWWEYWGRLEPDNESPSKRRPRPEARHAKQRAESPRQPARGQMDLFGTTP
ncbi:hypothetical protein [Streptomyces sp. NPDC057623]|uniref:hypothetical protein n=1 Tax=Streptomyces sp. NPDC057623 TaxID=3346187 RepID=UPI0036CA195E